MWLVDVNIKFLFSILFFIFIFYCSNYDLLYLCSIVFVVLNLYVVNIYVLNVDIRLFFMIIKDMYKYI